MPPHPAQDIPETNFSCSRGNMGKKDRKKFKNQDRVVLTIIEKEDVKKKYKLDDVMARSNEYLLFDPEYWEHKADEYLTSAAAVAGISPKFSEELMAHARQCEKWSREALKRKHQRARMSRLNPRVKASLYPVVKSG